MQYFSVCMKRNAPILDILIPFSAYFKAIFMKAYCTIYHFSYNYLLSYLQGQHHIIVIMQHMVLLAELRFEDVYLVFELVFSFDRPSFRFPANHFLLFPLFLFHELKSFLRLPFLRSHCLQLQLKHQRNHEEMNGVLSHDSVR